MRLLVRSQAWRSVAAAPALLTLLLGTACSQPVPTQDTPAQPAAPNGPVGDRSWPMFGGTPRRNLVNLAEKNIPDDWSFKEGKEKNFKWAAQLGTLAYGGPVVSGGKIFVGTNNDK